MKYTLIAFHWEPDDSRPGGGSDFARQAWPHRGERIEIAQGVYLYETAKDWKCIHQLCEVFRTHNRTFAMLHFESETSELFGFFDHALAEQLKSTGISFVANLSDAKT